MWMTLKFVWTVSLNVKSQTLMICSRWKGETRWVSLSGKREGSYWYRIGQGDLDRWRVEYFPGRENHPRPTTVHSFDRIDRTYQRHGHVPLPELSFVHVRHRWWWSSPPRSGSWLASRALTWVSRSTESVGREAREKIARMTNHRRTNIYPVDTWCKKDDEIVKDHTLEERTSTSQERKKFVDTMIHSFSIPIGCIRRSIRITHRAFSHRNLLIDYQSPFEKLSSMSPKSTFSRLTQIVIARGKTNRGCRMEQWCRLDRTC